MPRLPFLSRPGLCSWPLTLLLVIVIAFLGSSCSAPSGDSDSEAHWEEADQLIAQGEALEEEGETERALELYSQAIVTAPGNTSGWNSKNLLLLGQARFDEALSNAEGWTRQIPKNPSAWMAMGYSLEAMGRYREAVAAYEKTQELTADSSLPFMVEFAGIAERRKAECEAALDDPARAEDVAYARQAVDLLNHVTEVNQEGAAFLNAATRAESVKLLADYEAAMDDCIAEATAIEPPSSMAEPHSQLVDGLKTIKKAVSDTSSAVKTLGDSAAMEAAMEAASETFLEGSEKVEAYRLQLIERTDP